ncbi:MAG: hypothetical protein ACOCU2_01030 [Bacillota bacterium]
MENKTIAVNLFNETWDLLEKHPRTKEENALMIHKAHASLYHWLKAGTALEAQRGEWLVSHVYAVLEMGESAVFHANRCLDLTQANAINDFDLTFAYEALARAHALKDIKSAREYYERAKDSLDQIEDPNNKAYAASQLENINI